jgi:hypothetical protein
MNQLLNFKDVNSEVNKRLKTNDFFFDYSNNPFSLIKLKQSNLAYNDKK